MNEEIKKLKHSENWFGFRSFYDIIIEKDYSICAEIGVWKGHSIIYLAQGYKKRNIDISIYAIDLFDKWESENESVKSHIPFIYDIYNENLEDSGVRDIITDVKGCSWDVASQFKDSFFDFVFIDGDHSYSGVCKDINAWLPKVKYGGIIGGHDYFNANGVKQAVNELIVDFKLLNDSGVWYKEIL